jgi:predicted AlkP superfamily pyrophosphatase or phosphodiesterase
MKRAIVVTLLVAAGASAPAADVAPAGARRPALVVILAVDQLRTDYADRYGHQWTKGLRRLLDRGARFPEAAYPYMNTVTCAGHATIATGTFPAAHGIPLNAWWDRSLGRQMSCTDDPRATNIGHGRAAASGGDSAWRLRVPTFADELRAQSGVPPRVVSLSLKPRSAIMLAGQRADLVAWYGGEAGFVTSSAYAPAPVGFLSAFLSTHPIEQDAGRAWDRARPASDYLFEDDGEGEKPDAPWSRTFPHALPGAPGAPAAGFYALWEDTPFADAYLGRMAAAAVEAFNLGRGPGTDYLAVSFSTLDMVGHAFGPRSHEVQDILIQLDATMGTLLETLDRRVGPDRYIVALTADHGVSPIPEQMAALGVPAGRIDGRGIVTRVNAALEPFLGPGPHVATLIYTDLYFRDGVWEKLAANPAAMQAVVDTIEATPGVLRALRRDDIAAVRLGGDALALTALSSHAPGRSGDILIVPQPYFLNSTAATTHGTGYRYDARVPVVLAGPGIRRGEYLVPATPADIAPTLAHLVGITLPRPDGRVLREALDDVALPGPRPTAARQ